MDCFLLITGFFAGLFILFVFGRFIGHIMGLDDYLNYKPSDNPGHNVSALKQAGIEE